MSAIKIEKNYKAKIVKVLNSDYNLSKQFVFNEAYNNMLKLSFENDSINQNDIEINGNKLKRKQGF